MLVAVAGWPVAHSRSPVMHNAAFAALGMHDWLYTRLPLAPERFAETVRALPASGYRGINVTIPHKEAAAALADSRSDTVAQIGAANTLSFEPDGSIAADNTDAQGFLDALGEPLSGRTVLVLGAGGAARAVVWAAREAGADVTVWNRTAERATRLADDFGVEALARPRPAEVLVNTTSVGLAGSLDDLPLADVGRPGAVADLVYGASEAPVTAWARAHGARVTDGLEILVRQGALSFVRWTGEDPPLARMREAVRTCGNGP